MKQQIIAGMAKTMNSLNQSREKNSAKLKELQDLEAQIKSNEAFACQLINESKEFNPINAHRLDEMRSSYNKLLELLGAGPNDDIVELFSSKVIRREAKMNKQQQKIHELEKALKEIEQEELSLKHPEPIPSLSLSPYCNNLKDLIHSYDFQNLQDQFKRSSFTFSKCNITYKTNFKIKT